MKTRILFSFVGAAMRRAGIVLEPLDGATSFEQVREILYRNRLT